MNIPIKDVKLFLKTSISFSSYFSWNCIVYDPGCIIEPVFIELEELKHYNAIVWMISILVNGEYYFSRYTAEKDNPPFIVLEN